MNIQVGILSARFLWLSTLRGIWCSFFSERWRFWCGVMLIPICTGNSCMQKRGEIRLIPPTAVTFPNPRKLFTVTDLESVQKIASTRSEQQYKITYFRGAEVVRENLAVSSALNWPNCSFRLFSFGPHVRRGQKISRVPIPLRPLKNFGLCQVSSAPSTFHRVGAQFPETWYLTLSPISTLHSRCQTSHLLYTIHILWVVWDPDYAQYSRRGDTGNSFKGTYSSLFRMILLHEVCSVLL